MKGLVRDWAFVRRTTEPAIAAAPRDYLDNIQASLAADRIPDAVVECDTRWIFDWLVGVSQFQGICDANDAVCMAKHGIVGWHDIRAALDARPACHRLRSYWSSAECRYRKGTGTCSEPRHLPSCPLPRHPARKGSLIQAAYALFLFVRDICEDDLIGWIDRRLAAAGLSERRAYD